MMTNSKDNIADFKDCVKRSGTIRKQELKGENVKNYLESLRKKYDM